MVAFAQLIVPKGSDYMPSVADIITKLTGQDNRMGIVSADGIDPDITARQKAAHDDEEKSKYGYALQGKTTGKAPSTHRNDGSQRAKSERKERKHSEKLMHMLHLLDAMSYEDAKEYVSTELSNTETATHAILHELNLKEVELKQQLENVHTMETDDKQIIPVFIDKDGIIRNEDGQEVFGDLIFNENAMSADEYKETKTALARVLSHQEELQRYDQDVLQHSREQLDALGEEDTPENRQKLKNILDEIEAERPAIVATVMANKQDLPPAAKVDAFLEQNANPGSSAPETAIPDFSDEPTSTPAPVTNRLGSP